MKFKVGRAQEKKTGFIVGYNRFQLSEIKENGNGSYSLVFKGLVKKDGVEQQCNYKVSRFLTKKDSQEVDLDILNQLHKAVGLPEVKEGEEIDIKAEGAYVKVVQILLKNRKNKVTKETFLDMPLYDADNLPLIIGADDDPSNCKPAINDATDF